MRGERVLQVPAGPLQGVGCQARQLLQVAQLPPDPCRAPGAPLQANQPNTHMGTRHLRHTAHTQDGGKGMPVPRVRCPHPGGRGRERRRPQRQPRLRRIGGATRRAGPRPGPQGGCWASGAPSICASDRKSCRRPRPAPLPSSSSSPGPAIGWRGSATRLCRLPSLPPSRRS